MSVPTALAAAVGSTVWLGGLMWAAGLGVIPTAAVAVRAQTQGDRLAPFNVLAAGGTGMAHALAWLLLPVTLAALVVDAAVWLALSAPPSSRQAPVHVVALVASWLPLGFVMVGGIITGLAAVAWRQQDPALETTRALLTFVVGHFLAAALMLPLAMASATVIRGSIWTALATRDPRLRPAHWPSRACKPWGAFKPGPGWPSACAKRLGR
jgi:hypothetical protein